MEKVVGAIANGKKLKLDSIEVGNETVYFWRTEPHVPCDRLQFAIASKKWNIKTASEKCGIKYELFEKYVSGEKEIPLVIVDKIADVFKIPVNFFITDETYSVGGIL